MRPVATGPLGRTVLLLCALHLVALACWILGAPRVELVSVGDGTGVPFPDSGAASSSQLLTAVPLLSAAAVCTTLVLWRRHPGLRRPAGVLVVAGWSALCVAATVRAAGPLARLLTGPDPSSPAGSVVEMSPKLGPLFRGPVLAGVAGPAWEAMPASAGWIVLAIAVSLATTAWLAWSALTRPDRDGSGRELPN